MDLSEFSGKVTRAADLLRVLCSQCNPSEEQVKDATKSAGLPVTFEADSFVLDPVRSAVFVKAYVPSSVKAKGVTVERVVENAWRWHEKARLRVGV